MPHDKARPSGRQRSATGSRGSWRAVTRPLEREIDLNDLAAGGAALFVRDGVGVAGIGVAARLPLDEVDDALAAIAADDAVGVAGSGPVALGVLPFLPGGAVDLVIPRVVVGKGDGGERWVTVVDGEGLEPVDLDAMLTVAPRAPADAASYRIHPGVAVEVYLAAVTAARDAVRDGRLDKAVIARDVIVEVDRPLDIGGVLQRLRASFGSSYRYAFEGFIGASPELLVERRGDVVRSHPLAGTAPRSGDPTTDARLAAELLASVKDQVEHRVVIDVVYDTLIGYCSYLDWQEEPSVVAVANVQHLGTAMEGRLSDPAPSVLELARRLSPTPALGGHPRQAAVDLITAVEGFERGRYGGAVGWVDAAGNGTWAVAIRCAEISTDRRTARLFAGGGIVADSVPERELAETQAKLQAMLSAIVRA